MTRSPAAPRPTETSAAEASTAPFQLARSTLGKGDLSRSAQHTAAGFRIGKRRHKRTFRSGDGYHAEDLVVSAVEHMAKNGDLGKTKGEVPITVYVTKSPCTDADGSHVRTSGKKTVPGCTQKLRKLHGRTINGYKIRLRLKIHRPYMPAISGAKQASLNAVDRMAADGISIGGISSNDSMVSRLSSSKSAKAWRVRQRLLLSRKKAKKA